MNSFTKYHKIQSVYKRDPANGHRTFLYSQFSLPEFEYLQYNEWQWTEKVDGTNIRVNWDGESVLFGGRTDRAQIPNHLLNKLQSVFTVNLFNSMKPMILFGEGYGKKINRGGKYIPDGVDFALFDVLIGGIWLERSNVDDIASQLGIKSVPVIGSGTIHDAVGFARNGFVSTLADTNAEGIVIRPTCEILRRNGERVISKLKYRDFSHG